VQGGGRSRLGHREGARAHSEAYALRSEVPVVAATAVDVSVWTVVQVRRVQRTMALAAIEASLVPHAILRDHLLGGVHWIAAARAAVPVVSLLTDLGLSIDAAKEKQDNCPRVWSKITEEAGNYSAGQSG